MTANAAFLLVARIVSALTTVAVLAVVGRTRGLEALGVVGVGFALGAIAAVISDLGSGSLFIREAARDLGRSGVLLGAAFVIRLVTIPIVLLVVWAVAAIGFPGSVPTILLVTVGLVAQQTAEATRFVFLARQRMSISAAHVIVENLAWAAVIAISLVLGASLPAAVGAGSATLALSVVGGLVLADRVGGVRPARPNREAAVTLARQARPFIAFNVLGIAYSRIDTLLVGILAPTAALAAAGAYFAAARLVAAFEYLPDAVSRAIYPELSRRTVADPRSAAPLLGGAARALLVIALPVPGLLFVTAPWLMPTLFGSGIAGDAWVAAALAIVVPIRSLGYLYGMTLTSSDRQGRRAAAAALGLLVVVGLDALLLPRIGIAGAVVGAVSASLVVVAIYGREVIQRIGSVGIGPATLAWAVVGAAGATIAGLVVDRWVHEVVAGLVTAGLYAGFVAVSPLRAVFRGSARSPRSGAPAGGEPVPAAGSGGSLMPDRGESQADEDEQRDRGGQVVQRGDDERTGE